MGQQSASSEMTLPEAAQNPVLACGLLAMFAGHASAWKRSLRPADAGFGVGASARAQRGMAAARAAHCPWSPGPAISKFIKPGLALVSLLLAVAWAQSLEIVLSPKPQAYPNTCQSYALAFAFARAGVPGFEVAGVAELRASEGRIRKALEQQGDPYAHATWQAATKTLTGGAFTLERREFSDPESFMAFLGDTTGVTNAGSLGTVLSFLTVRTPVLTSFSSIGSSSYPSGHIVAVLGTDGPPHQSRKLLLLNSAIKAGSAVRLSCESGDLPGDARYKAAAGLEDAYTLKTYSGKFVALWLHK